MIIQKIAFLIPIYPPHYHFIYKFINRLQSNAIQMDVYLVFTNTSDYNSFEMKSDIKHMILSKAFEKDPNVKYIKDPIITYKKFFGLKQLSQSKYDYIICCDSEIDIIPTNFTSDNIEQKIQQIFHNKMIYAGDTHQELEIQITSGAAEVFPNNYEELNKVTNNFKFYFWWSDLPVYRREDIDTFLNMIDHSKINAFDYIMYQYYLILFHDFKIINITPLTNVRGSLEKLNTSDINILNRLIDIKYGFSYITRRFYNSNKKFLESQKSFLVCHLDR